MSKKTPFADIGTSKKKTDPDSFINGAKVDGQSNNGTNRRGASYKDKETGKTIKLDGKVIQIPVNGAELALLQKGADAMGLSLATYLRCIGLEKAKTLI